MVGLGDRMEYSFRILGVIVKCEGPCNILSTRFIGQRRSVFLEVFRQKCPSPSTFSWVCC